MSDCFKPTQEGWVKHLYDDWDAVVGRAKGLWAPRWRTATHGGTAVGTANKNDGDAIAATERKISASSATHNNVSLKEDTLDGEDEWGGRGWRSVTISSVDRDGGGDGGADVATGAGSGEPSARVVGKSDGSTGDKGKGRWVRGRWAAVDVRSVQSRLSRIVDDTSARIRSNIVQVGGALM